MEPKYYLILKKQRLQKERIKKILIGSVFIVIGFLGPLIYFVNPYSLAQGSFSDSALTPVQVHPVRSMELTQEIGTDIEIRPSSTIPIMMPISTARVAKLYVDAGDYVEEGQILLELDSALLTLALQNAEKEVENTKVKLEEIKKTQGTRHEEWLTAAKRAESEVESTKARLEEAKKTEAIRHKERVAAANRAEGEVENAKAKLEEAKKAQINRREELIGAFKKAEEALKNVRSKGNLKVSDSTSVEPMLKQRAEGFIKAKNALAHENTALRSLVTAAETTYKRAVESAIRVRNRLTHEEVSNQSELTSLELTHKQALENLVKIQNNLKNEEVTTRAELASAEAAYSKAYAKRAQIQDDLVHTTIKAPASGIIRERNIYPGETLINSTEFPRSLLTLEVIDPILAIAEMDLRVMQSMYVGQGIKISLEDIQGTDLEGTIIKIEDDSQTFERKTYIRMANPHLALKPGLSDYAKLQTKRIVPGIPRTALIEQTDSSAIFVVDPEFVARERSITVGFSVSGLIEVISGVQEGEQVVTAGQKFIKDGERVKIVADMSVALSK
jgi:RND family efflux transporter MFP subunit